MARYFPAITLAIWHSSAVYRGGSKKTGDWIYGYDYDYDCDCGYMGIENEDSLLCLCVYMFSFVSKIFIGHLWLIQRAGVLVPTNSQYPLPAPFRFSSSVSVYL